MAVNAIFPETPIGKGMYESFYLRAVAPEEPLGAWLRYTVHKRPGHPPQGSLWCTIFDATRGAPFMHKHTTPLLTVPADGWIQIGEPQAEGGRLGPGAADGHCGPARWSLRIGQAEPELRHLKQSWLYRAPLPRTKLTSPAPAASFDGTIELPERTIELRDWRGMVGHNWGAEHAERWIWLHGIDFVEDRSAWLDVAVGRVLLAGRLTPWLASGAISFDGRRVRLGGLGARGVQVAESPVRCSLTLPGEAGLLVQAHVDNPPGAAAGWRYADPGTNDSEGRGSEHDVVNCSVASLSLNVRPHAAAARTLRTLHGAAYELGMRERDHGVALAPFDDG
ncbi:MAG TPA: hypothetical protein VFW38_06185 [Solirubrobacteraceae bacterium]|nr:hypothetical protein [Solirubrobacteraceae bacterium]